MKVSTATAIMSVDVAATLQFFARTGEGDDSYETTSWFVGIMRRWFDIMTSRHHSSALTHKNKKKKYIDIRYCFLRTSSIFFIIFRWGQPMGNGLPSSRVWFRLHCPQWNYPKIWSLNEDLNMWCLAGFRRIVLKIYFQLYGQAAKT